MLVETGESRTLDKPQEYITIRVDMIELLDMLIAIGKMAERIRWSIDKKDD